MEFEYLSKEHIIKNRRLEKVASVGVYFLIKDNEIVYIGKTRSLFNRLNSHKSIIDYDSYYFLPVCETVLDFEESKYILKYMPKLNKTISCPECTDLLGWYSRSRIAVQLKVSVKSTDKLNELLKSKESISVFNNTYYDIGNLKTFGLELTDIIGNKR